MKIVKPSSNYLKVLLTTNYQINLILMSKTKELPLNLEITFLKAPKKTTDIKDLMKKVRSLIEKEK